MAEKADNVVSMVARRTQKKVEGYRRHMDPKGLLCFPFEDVRQHAETPHKANLASTPISYGANATVAMKRMLAEFRIGTPLPETMGQLRGLLDYSLLILDYATKNVVTSQEDAELAKECYLRVIRRNYPLLVDCVEAYDAQDFAELARLHRERLPTLEPLSQTFCPNGVIAQPK